MWTQSNSIDRCLGLHGAGFADCFKALSDSKKQICIQLLHFGSHSFSAMKRPCLLKAKCQFQCNLGRKLCLVALDQQKMRKKS